MQNARGPNLQAEQIPAQNNAYQSGIPYGGQQIVGQPVYLQYQQNYGYPQQQYYQPNNYVSGYPPAGYSQVVYVGNQQPQQLLIAQSQINPLLIAELELRHSIKYFYGCNCLCGVFVLILLILRCILLFEFQDDSDSVASGVIFIIGDCIWVISAILGIYGVSHYKERFLLYYQIGIILAVIMDIIGTIIAVTSGNNVIGVFVFFVIAMSIIYFLFIRSARNIRYKMENIQLLKNQQIQNGQQSGNNENLIQNIGPILVQ